MLSSQWRKPAGELHSGLWVAGALLGGISGGQLGSRARQRQEERYRLFDERLQRLEARSIA
jgi:hypothetical protein